jgi:putative chitinase
VDSEQLRSIMGCAVALAQRWAEPLTAAMALYAIDTPVRQAAFLSQVGHESGRLQYTRELWGPTPAQVGYEGRRDLGNLQPGDGKRFMGRGLIQVTGRANYHAAAAALGIDCENQPGLLEEPSNAARSACWFWQSHGINVWADAGDFDGVCDMVNRGRKTAPIGDTNGYAERVAIWNQARKVLGV